ncbi:class I SAM-dependent methyltransferase [Fulvivirga sp. M361]|uniref:class I SAM-dependent methyltransferase n=1 Tax=Fulvivirga sp. M361 TaxID=2594266 RepID=UPI00117A0771|nr:class I SAM-dependent methyltransferase [Fulvivirga sp. M361]TRX58635.1 class I SAM-dependent methyltransferase [Fulvivirga sp. M361]
MNYKALNQQVGNLDLYLLDQILKGRFEGFSKILDAGCGEGRNLPYFVNNGYEVYGIDLNPQAILMAMMSYRSVPKDNWAAGNLSELPWPDQYFDAVICSAVLHFAESHEHFHTMMKELARVIARGGLLFIRAATQVGLSAEDPESKFTYLMEPEQLFNIDKLYPFNFLELPKSVVVNDQRSMGVLVLERK